MFKNLFRNSLFWVALLTFLFSVWNILSPFDFYLEPDIVDAIVGLDWSHLPSALLSTIVLIFKGKKGGQKDKEVPKG